MAKDVRALLLDEDVAAFNKIRVPGERLDLFAEDLSGLNLAGIDLSGVNLEKSDLSGTDLSGGRLAKVWMSESDAPGVKMGQTFALLAKIRDADLTEADLSGADFGKADLSGSRLDDSTGASVRLAGARLKEISAQRAKWPGVDLQEAGIEKADFTEADLTGAKLGELQGHGARFDRASLDRAEGAKVDLRKGSFQGASLVGVSLVGVRLEDADLTGADLSGANLTKANLSRAKLDGAKLDGARLVEANLDGATFEGASWKGADLTGIDAAGLGLAEDAVASLAAWGAAAVVDGEAIYDDVSCAVVGDTTTLLWPNPEGETSSSIRWQVWRGGARIAHGVLPVSGASVLSHAALAYRGRFALVCLAERAGTASVLRWDVDLDGALTGPVTSPVGYEPSVLPVFRSDGERLWMWGLSRRGPSVCVHRDDGEGMVRVGEHPWAQARGFIGRHRPVLMCKAGILMHLSESGIGSPLRAPDGFPSKVFAIAPVEERMVAVWNAEKAGRDKGGLRWRMLGERVAAEPEPLAVGVAATLLDALPDGECAWLAWCEPVDKKVCRVRMLRVPDGGGVAFRIEGPAPDELRWVETQKGPALLILLASGMLVMVSPDGKVLSQFGDTAASA